MQIINPKAAASSETLSNKILKLLDLRSDLADLATFLVIEPGDSVYSVEVAVGFPISADFPPWEWALRHAGVYEAPIVTSDSGACTVLIVPDEQGIDTELLSILRSQAQPAISSEH